MFDLTCFHGKGHFQVKWNLSSILFVKLENYFVFQSNYRSTGNSKHISAWKSKVLSDGSIKAPATSNKSLSPVLNYINTKIQVKFHGSSFIIEL